MNFGAVFMCNKISEYINLVCGVGFINFNRLLSFKAIGTKSDR